MTDPWRNAGFRSGDIELSGGSGQVTRVMSWNEIAILVDRARSGDRSAYGELVVRFQPTVYALALVRLRNPAEAQELTQEVFIHMMKKLDQLRDPRCFAGWLRQITVRMAINRLTRRGPVRGTDPEFLEGSYNIFKQDFIAAPYPITKGLEATYDYVAQTRADIRAHKPEEFVDPSFIAELDKSGFIKKLYEQK